MINIIKQEITFDESLRQRLEIISEVWQLHFFENVILPR